MPPSRCKPLRDPSASQRQHYRRLLKDVGGDLGLRSRHQPDDRDRPVREYRTVGGHASDQERT